MDEQFVHEDQMRNARTQGVGSMVSEQNRQNALELMRKMHKIDTQNAAAKARIENNLDKALQCVDNVRDFVGSPEHILGNCHKIFLLSIFKKCVSSSSSARTL